MHSFMSNKLHLILPSCPQLCKVIIIISVVSNHWEYEADSNLPNLTRRQKKKIMKRLNKTSKNINSNRRFSDLPISSDSQVICGAYIIEFYIAFFIRILSHYWSIWLSFSMLLHLPNYSVIHWLKYFISCPLTYFFLHFQPYFTYHGEDPDVQVHLENVVKPERHKKPSKSVARKRLGFPDSFDKLYDQDCHSDDKTAAEIKRFQVTLIKDSEVQHYLISIMYKHKLKFTPMVRQACLPRMNVFFTQPTKTSTKCRISIFRNIKQNNGKVMLRFGKIW